MIDKLVRQLSHPSSEQRIKAIKALAQTKDPAALQYLATVVKTDKDPEVRDFALKAGRYIKKQAAATDEYAAQPSRASAGWRTSSYLIDEDLPEEPEPTAPEPDPFPENDEVSWEDKEEAKGFVKQAIEYEKKGDNYRAVHFLALALKKNPQLRQDTYTMTVASSVTGLPADEAARKLYKAASDPSKAKKGKKEGPTWGDALIDIVIYGVVIAATVGVTIIVLVNLVLAKSPQKVSATPGDPFDPSQLIHQLTSQGMVYILTVAIGAGVYAVINLVIGYIAIHFTATAMMGGEGSLVGLIRKVTLYLTGTYAVSFAGIIAGLLLSFANPDLSSSIIGLTVVFSLIATFFFAVRVGSNYGFGIGKGCGTVVLAYIIIAILFGCILPLLTSSTPIGR